MKRPYVCVTGASTRDEVYSLRDALEIADFGWRELGHDAVTGFLFSDKTLRGEPIINPIYKNRYPPEEDKWDLCQNAKDNGRVAIHYNTKEPETLAEQIDLLLGNLCEEYDCDEEDDGIEDWRYYDMLQLNMVWPNVDEIKKIRKAFKGLDIIFQASSRTMEGKTPQQFIEQLKKYESCIEYVLLDPSGGLGREFEAERVVPFYETIRKNMPHVGIGFAGGLSGENLESKMSSVIKLIGTNDISIDAEGKLRTDDKLDMNKVKEYLQAARRVFPAP